uniref:Immunoglobulin C1-set domain-containing protein n=1 Tax=Labrus bergylta TaxID=56723 RepID=A0A3Q3ENK2_9LABR
TETLLQRKLGEQLGTVECVVSHRTSEIVNPDKETLICLPVCPPDLPTVSLLRKTPSSRVTCHATGFYPNRAMMFWRKDGEELHEDVDNGEILPNHDGSFQISADLQLVEEAWPNSSLFWFAQGRHLLIKKSLILPLVEEKIKLMNYWMYKYICQ